MERIFNNIILTVIVVVLYWGVSFAIKYINEYTQENIKNAKVKKAIEKALKIVTLVVNETNQTFVKELKDINGFGREQAEEAFNAAKKSVIEILDKETKEILDEEFLNADKFLNSAIESKVWESKGK